MELGGDFQEDLALVEGGILHHPVQERGDDLPDAGPGLEAQVLHDLAAAHDADARDDAGASGLTLVLAVGGEGGELEEGRARIEKALEALAAASATVGRADRRREAQRVEGRVLVLDPGPDDFILTADLDQLVAKDIQRPAFRVGNLRPVLRGEPDLAAAGLARLRGRTARARA